MWIVYFAVKPKLNNDLVRLVERDIITELSEQYVVNIGSGEEEDIQIEFAFARIPDKTNREINRPDENNRNA